MAITHEHDDYLSHSSRWQKYRDASEGEYAVKARGQTYLPRKSTKQSDAEYNAYKQRAMYFNATGRTVNGLVGLMFRREADIEAPDVMDPILEDVTQDGVGFDELLKHAAEEVVIVGRGGVLVDFPAVEAPDNMREYAISGARPYATYYQAEAIPNWDTAYVDGRIIPGLVVLKETYKADDPTNEFKKIVRDQYRVLDLYEGKYRQRVFQKAVEGGRERQEWVVVEEYFPKMNGQPMTYIPFEFFGPIDGRAIVQKSPITDIATVNLSHYRTLADLENGRHWCGSPTPVFTGDFVTDTGDDVAEVRLGSENGIHMSQGSAASFLEFAGGGLGELRSADEQKREMMAVLGSRILAPEKKQAEAAETARIHRAGEESTLQSIAHSVSRSATRILEYLRDWSGATGDVSVEINTDFVPTEMTPQELQSTVMAWQAGAFTTQELFYRLKQGELIRSDKTFEDHVAEIEEEGPKLGTFGGFGE